MWDLGLFLARNEGQGVEAASSVIFEDNKACISISTGDTDKKRIKHIAKHWHFVREKCAAGLVVLKCGLVVLVSGEARGCSRRTAQSRSAPRHVQGP